MNILIVDNAPMVLKGRRHFTNALNGLFVGQLHDVGNNILYYQFEIETTNNICSYSLEDNGIRCIPVNRFSSKILSYLKVFLKSFRAFKEADFVYFYYPNSLRFLSLVCLIYRKQFGLYVRGMKDLDGFFSRFLYKRAMTVFTVSDLFTNMVNEFAGMDNKAHTIRPMIPYTEYDVITTREYSKKDKYVALFLGRLDRDKGLIELLESMKLLSQKGKDISLKIVGDGAFMNEVNNYIEANSLQDRVTCLGPVYDDEKKKSYYMEADFYVLPTYHEGFPRTLYEAMIFGTPIITTFVGGIPALMVDGENSMKIQPRSSEDIVRALSYAMDNYEIMGHYARQATVLVSSIVDHRRLSHAEHLNQILTECL